MKPHRTIPPRFNEPADDAPNDDGVRDAVGADGRTGEDSLNGAVPNDDAAAATDYATWCGKRIAERFLLEKFVGTGTFGAVFRGSDQRFPGRVVAVKIGVGVVKHDYFFREARLLGQLNSEFVVSVYEYGDDDGVPYIVMEFLHGRTLADLLKDTDGPLSEGMLSQCVEEVGRALASMHAVNLIHRDLKPDNIMLVDAADSLSHDGRRQRFKIIDFGISSKIDAADSQRNATFDGAGTPEFMAPEQLQSESVTAAADVYAFGVLIFALHSGRVPFQATTPTVSGLAELVNCVMNTTAPKLSQMVSSDRFVTAKLDALIAECLAKRPEERPESIAEVCRRYREAIVQTDKTLPTHSQDRKNSALPFGKKWLRLLGATGLSIVAIAGALFGRSYFEPHQRDASEPTVVATSSSLIEPHLDIEKLKPAEAMLPAAPDVPEVLSGSPSRPETEPAKDDPESTPEIQQPSTASKDSQDPVVPREPSKVEPAAPQQTSPPLWSPTGFTPGPTSQVFEDFALSTSLQLADPEIAFRLIVPETSSQDGIAEGAPAKAFYISELLISRGVFASVSGATSKPAATTPLAEQPSTDSEDAPQINLDDVDVGDLLDLLEAKEKEDREQKTTTAPPDAAAEHSPMTNLTWFGADRFCLLLTADLRSRSPVQQRDQLRIRLPSHPEWWAAVGYFSEPHAADDVVRNPAVTGVRQIGHSGFEWTRSAVDGRILNTTSVSDLAAIALNTQVMTPGSEDRRLTFGMFNSDDSRPAGRPSGSNTAFRVVLEVPDLKTTP